MGNRPAAHGRFPAGGIAKGESVYASAFAMLLPYLDDAALARLYDTARPWQEQGADIAAAAIPIFDCPSTSEPNPMNCPLLEGVTPITVFGTVDYGLSKGATDGLPRGQGIVVSIIESCGRRLGDRHLHRHGNLFRERLPEQRRGGRQLDEQLPQRPSRRL